MRWVNQFEPSITFVKQAYTFSDCGAGEYVMPGLPCGGNLTGRMVETLTGKSLGKKYFVYKYTQPLQGSSVLPDGVWMPDSESQVARYLTENQQLQGDYLLQYLPRVCVRDSLFRRCSKKPPSNTKTNEQLLCLFISTHQGFFFEVDGGAQPLLFCE